MPMGCGRALERRGALLALLVLRLRRGLRLLARVLREVCGDLLRDFLRKLLRIEAQLRLLLLLLLFSHSVHPLRLGCLIPAPGHPAIKGAYAIGWTETHRKNCQSACFPMRGHERRVIYCLRRSSGEFIHITAGTSPRVPSGSLLHPSGCLCCCS